jgi:hypothetical protein
VARWEDRSQRRFDDATDRERRERDWNAIVEGPDGTTYRVRPTLMAGDAAFAVLLLLYVMTGRGGGCLGASTAVVVFNADAELEVAAEE